MLAKSVYIGYVASNKWQLRIAGRWHLVMRLMLNIHAHLPVMWGDAVMPNLQVTYGIVIEYRCTAMQNSMHFIWIRASQQCCCMLYPITVQKCLIQTSDRNFSFYRSLFVATLLDWQSCLVLNNISQASSQRITWQSWKQIRNLRA